VAVAGGRLFTTGYRGDDEFCTALSGKDGKRLWSAKVGPAVKEGELMRHLSQRTPTVDGERVYVVTAFAELVCLSADAGKELWRKNYVRDFEGKRNVFGFCDYPLVDGDRLVVTPGGERAAVAALDRRTGEPVWACPLPGGETQGHAVLVAAEVGGVRQYVNHLERSMVGVAAKDGRLLWRYEGMGTRTAATHAPVVRGDTVFYASGYGAGDVLLRILKKGDSFAAEEVYRHPRRPYQSWLGSATQVGSHVYINGTEKLMCLERRTGEVAWEHPVRRSTFTAADGHLYVRSLDGVVTLVKADPSGYRQSGEFTPPWARPSQYGSTFPVVAGGHLYLRDEDVLLCYDVREPDRRKPVPDSVFVPTPDDVAAKMLELAGVRKADLVYDLGSGDGRVVIAAAKAYGCRAVGVELDKELVRTARERAEEAGVGHLVRFEHADLFEADFSGADVVALYLLPAVNGRLAAKLDRLRPGSRVVAHHFPIPGARPDKEVKVRSEEDGVERSVYLYTVPLKKK
jgi:outer membrane protein assembly factor BamB/protein-L-isoaspartate O-methyltransferase